MAGWGLLAISSCRLENQGTRKPGVRILSTSRLWRLEAPGRKGKGTWKHSGRVQEAAGGDFVLLGIGSMALAYLVVPVLTNVPFLMFCFK